ncbi:hypothetical protein [Streptomyces clavuligerus]|uniref:Uncharacterized protein n=1 Tax=Streptomyces clavuligerus TaxID=1901 RepID=B5GND0_STRCL|nr:hypothetical protein [Streptomyces clavuligerus]EDY47826.1 hypothetical protein SSCG_00854 [Streptomyces clavuligerus]EFG04188.1 Hypothetical protein SCLAV_p0701 [Streptomyces clavuligerus]MBY6307332.1 hypothetical protein [Streptomyces clavuligerus]QCS10099.1 hypothetical protein CRV15_31495 [Streptomyces clavuligerus]QPJ97855.1 hypothetical protein GE265_32960 [Streptomyces clavuligerus]
MGDRRVKISARVGIGALLLALAAPYAGYVGVREYRESEDRSAVEKAALQIVQQRAAARTAAESKNGAPRSAEVTLFAVDVDLAAEGFARVDLSQTTEYTWEDSAMEGTEEDTSSVSSHSFEFRKTGGTWMFERERLDESI